MRNEPGRLARALTRSLFYKEKKKLESKFIFKLNKNKNRNTFIPMMEFEPEDEAHLLLQQPKSGWWWLADLMH